MQHVDLPVGGDIMFRRHRRQANECSTPVNASGQRPPLQGKTSPFLKVPVVGPLRRPDHGDPLYPTTQPQTSLVTPSLYLTAKPLEESSAMNFVAQLEDYLRDLGAEARKKHPGEHELSSHSWPVRLLKKPPALTNLIVPLLCF